MTNTLAPNSCLVAILLIAKTKSEPRLVFHYPPRPGEASIRLQRLLKDKEPRTNSDSSSENEDEVSDDPPIAASTPSSPKDATPPDMDEAGSVSPQKREDLGERKSESRWNHLFGYEPSVHAKLLCPQPVTHRKRVEFGLDGKVFLGQPVFAGVDGAWKKQRKRRSSSKSTQALSLLESVIEEREEARSVEDSLEEIKEDAVLETEQSEPPRSSEHEDQTAKSPGQGIIHVARKTKAPLTMFHVVFVLDPPPLEYATRVKDLYDKVAKKFTKALRYEQARSDYVAEEVGLITSATKRAKLASGMSAANPFLTVCH